MENWCAERDPIRGAALPQRGNGLVEYAGLNPMGRKCRAGCPIANLQQTLDSLTSAGLSVAVYEEVAPALGKGKLKYQRALTQIVRRGQVGSDLPQDPTHDFPAAGLRQTRCPVNNIRLCKRSNVPRVRSPCVKVAFCAWYVCMDTYACIHVHILICLSVCLSASLRPSVPPSACLPACLSLYLSVCDS